MIQEDQEEEINPKKEDNGILERCKFVNLTEDPLTIKEAEISEDAESSKAALGGSLRGRTFGTNIE